LARDVAVKVLLDDHEAKADLRQRFVEEAKIAGALQHPGVVPVYDTASPCQRGWNSCAKRSGATPRISGSTWSWRWRFWSPGRPPPGGRRVLPRRPGAAAEHHGGLQQPRSPRSGRSNATTRTAAFRTVLYVRRHKPWLRFAPRPPLPSCQATSELRGGASGRTSRRW